jgi:NADPH:quinone reductase-like Zn-dependent oxidoreductase
MANMTAVRIHEFGGPEVLKIESIPVPIPAYDEVLIEIHAASVNPVDYKTRAGHYPVIKREDLPITMGRDVSGTVTQCGKSVSNWQIGAAVHAQLDRDRGGYAQYVAVKAAQLAMKPNQLDHIQAAAVPLAALTAWQGLFDQGRLQAGESVLIHGAAGGVGHLAIQFAKVKGARVSTTVGAADMQFVSELGADEAIDYKSQRFEDKLQEVDLVYDLIGGETQDRSWRVLKRGGRLVSTIKPPPEDKARERGAQASIYMAQPNAAQLREVAELIDGGQVRVHVAAKFPLEQAAKAQEQVEKSHTQGKVVLVVK